MELHTNRRVGAQRSTAGNTWFLVYLEVPALSGVRTKTDGCQIRSDSVHATYPYHVRKFSTVKQQNNETQPYATGWHCALPESRHTGPPGGAFILWYQKGKACYSAASTVSQT